MKDKQAYIVSTALEHDIDEFWHNLSTIESTCPHASEVNCKSVLKGMSKLSEFMLHCCRQRNYFEIKKCGALSLHFAEPLAS